MSNFYAQVNNNKVVATCDSPNKMVAIDSNDSRLLGTVYDAIADTFTGYKIELTVDKSSITADGTDVATITATVTNWDDTAATDFTDDITFEVGGQQATETPVSGVATMPFTAAEAGDYTIKTVNTGDTILANGSVEVTANATA